jgi:hypothetical protein
MLGKLTKAFSVTFPSKARTLKDLNSNFYRRRNKAEALLSQPNLINLQTGEYSNNVRDLFKDLSTVGGGWTPEFTSVLFQKLKSVQFFENAGLEDILFLLEVLRFETTSSKAQSDLYRCLMLFVLNAKYSVLIKTALCLQILEMATRKQQFLKVVELLDFAVAYLMEQESFLDFYQRVQFYCLANAIKPLMDDENRYLENELLLQVESEAGKIAVDNTLWMRLLWTVVARRYSRIEENLVIDKSVLVDYDSTQKQLIKVARKVVSVDQSLKDTVYENRYSLLLTKTGGNRPCVTCEQAA